MAGVELKQLHRRFGDVVALAGIDLEIPSGEFVSFLGPSGCGKTTALRLIAGFDRPTSGRILVDGKDITGVPPNRRDIGMVFQAYSLFPNMTAVRNVEFGLRVRKEGRGVRRGRARELLELVGLDQAADRYPHQLSGGMQQRVALARALAIEPRLLLLDEPLSALDAKVRVQLREEIRRIQTRLGITTIYVTHDQEEALSISDRVAVLSHGQIEQIGSPGEIYGSTGDAVRRRVRRHDEPDRVDRCRPGVGARRVRRDAVIGRCRSWEAARRAGAPARPARDGRARGRRRTGGERARRRGRLADVPRLGDAAPCPRRADGVDRRPLRRAGRGASRRGTGERPLPGREREAAQPRGGRCRSWSSSPSRRADDLAQERGPVAEDPVDAQRHERRIRRSSLTV